LQIEDTETVGYLHKMIYFCSEGCTCALRASRQAYRVGGLPGFLSLTKKELPQTPGPPKRKKKKRKKQVLPPFPDWSGLEFTLLSRLANGTLESGVE
jgi:hypothetical protein